MSIRTTDAAALLSMIIGEVDREMFVVLCLDSQQSVITTRFVGIGGRDNVLVTPSEVLHLARSVGVQSIIVGHNHPPGDPTPSSNDLCFTNLLIATSVTFGILVMDHIIVSAGSHVSLRARGACPALSNSYLRPDRTSAQVLTAPHD